jgi:hypothetical protein
MVGPGPHPRAHPRLKIRMLPVTCKGFGYFCVARQAGVESSSPCAGELALIRGTDTAPPFVVPPWTN